MIEVNYEKQRNGSQLHSYRKHCREFSPPTNFDCFSLISELITFLSSFQKKKDTAIKLSYLHTSSP